MRYDSLKLLSNSLNLLITVTQQINPLYVTMTDHLTDVWILSMSIKGLREKSETNWGLNQNFKSALEAD